MNQNYEQVAELYAQGKIHWESDKIVAMLCTETTFEASDKTVGDLDGQRVAIQPISGRHFAGSLGMGLPVVFQYVGQGLEYQIIVALDDGMDDPKLLSFIDSNADDSPITLQRSGTLIIRPVLPSTPPSGQPPTIGVWLRLPA